MEEYIEKIKRVVERLSLDISLDHYDTNKEYYWENRNQLNNVIDKCLPDDKLKIIFNGHIMRLEPKEVLLEYPPVKLVPTSKFYTYVWA